MRITFVVPQLHILSGWRSMSVGIIRAMQSANIEAALLVAQEDQETASSLFPDSQIHVLPHIQGLDYGWRQAVPDLFNRWWQISKLDLSSIDLVHSLEAYPTGLMGHWISARLNIPHVISVAGSYGIRPHLSRLHRFIYERVLSQAAFVCPISCGTADMVKQYFESALSKTSVETVLLGTSYTEKVSADVAVNRTVSTPLTILSVGGVKERKGYHVSLQAFAQVKKRLPDVQYVIIGERESTGYQRRLQQLIEDQNIHDVSFLSVVSDDELAHQYRQASLFLLTPQQTGWKFEGFGLVYVEAGAYGLPVVGTKTGGVPDAVRNNETGFLAGPEDIDGLAEVIHRLLTVKELNLEMGLANRKWAEMLTWSRYRSQQYEVYQKAMESA